MTALDRLSHPVRPMLPKNALYIVVTETRPGLWDSEWSRETLDEALELVDECPDWARGIICFDKDTGRSIDLDFNGFPKSGR